MCLNQRRHVLCPGDIVLLSFPGAVRYTWPLARIVEIYPDPAGVVRTVKVICCGEEYLRPVSQIVPLELSCEGEEGRRRVDDGEDVNAGGPTVETTDADESADQLSVADVREEEELEQSIVVGAEAPRGPRSEPNTDPVPSSSASRESTRILPQRRAAVKQRQLMSELIEHDAL